MTALAYRHVDRIVFVVRSRPRPSIRRYTPTLASEQRVVKIILGGPHWITPEAWGTERNRS